MCRISSLREIGLEMLVLSFNTHTSLWLSHGMSENQLAEPFTVFK